MRRAPAIYRRPQHRKRLAPALESPRPSYVRSSPAGMAHGCKQPAAQLPAATCHPVPRPPVRRWAPARPAPQAATGARRLEALAASGRGSGAAEATYSLPPLVRAIQAVELACVLGALILHARSAAPQRQQAPQQPRQQASKAPKKQAAQLQPPPEPIQVPTVAPSAGLSTTLLGVALLANIAVRSAVSRWAGAIAPRCRPARRPPLPPCTKAARRPAHLNRRRPTLARRPSAGQQIALQAAAKLARLDASSQQQAEELARAKRQLDKLQIRVRLTGQDLRRPLSQVRRQPASTATLRLPATSWMCPAAAAAALLLWPPAAPRADPPVGRRAGAAGGGAAGRGAGAAG
jgi:hypothetical protein